MAQASFLLQKAKKIIDPLDAELLLSHVTQKSREFFIAHPEYPVHFFSNLKFSSLVKKRKKNIPLAYLTGHKEFFGLDFLVNKQTLVPRPETEVLVQSVLSEIEESKIKNQELRVSVIDVGTGSGCIPISILKTLQKNTVSLPVQTFAIDISKQALKVAKKNAQKNKVGITFFHGNLLEPIIKNPDFARPGDQPESWPIIITANLPYLTQEQFDTEASIQHEPVSALVAEDHGLALYKKLLEQIHTFDLQNTAICLFLEIDPSQSSKIRTCINTLFPQAQVHIMKDLSGNDRVVKIKL